MPKQGFSNEELEALSKAIDPNQDTPLDYYPLAGAHCSTKHGRAVVGGRTMRQCHARLTSVHAQTNQ